MYFENIIVYRSIRTVGCLSGKAYNICVREFLAIIFVKANGAIPTYTVYRLSDTIVHAIQTYRAVVPFCQEMATITYFSIG